MIIKMDDTDAIVNAIMDEKGPPYASSSFVVNIDTEGRVQCARVKYKKEVINVKGKDGLFYSEGCKNSSDPVTLNDFKTGDEVIQTEDGNCFGVNEGYSIEDLQFKDPISKKEVERDCFNKGLVSHSKFRRLQRQGFDFDVPRGQDAQKGKYKDSVASRVRETSKRRRFTSTEVTEKILDFKKLMDFRLEKRPLETSFYPDSDDEIEEEWVFYIPSEFKLLFPGLERFEIPYGLDSEVKLGKFARGVAYNKLLDGEAPLRIEKRNDYLQNIKIEIKDDNTPVVKIYFLTGNDINLDNSGTYVEIRVGRNLDIIGRIDKFWVDPTRIEPLPRRRSLGSFIPDERTIFV